MCRKENTSQNHNKPEHSFYKAGGTLHPTTPSYIEREADIVLRSAIEMGDYAYILATRQMGKSSAVIHAMHQLKKQGYLTCYIDISVVGYNKLSDDIWYQSLIYLIDDQLDLPTKSHNWWQDHADLDPVTRFIHFIRQEVLGQTEKNIVIFFDEIDITLVFSQFSADNFFAAIRACFDQRGINNDFKRLTFVLIGVTVPTNLHTDNFRTPFTIGTRIELRDFNQNELKQMAAGLSVVERTSKERLISKILEWTNGQPYISQAIFADIERRGLEMLSNKQIDAIIHELFLSEAGRSDITFAPTKRYLENDRRNRVDILELYRSILNGNTVERAQHNEAQRYALLYGLVRVDGNHITARNKIFETIFDLDWVETNLKEFSGPGST